MDVKVRPVGGGSHWPATEDEAIAWLRQRGGTADRELDDLETFADAVLAWRMRSLGFAAEYSWTRWRI